MRVTQIQASQIQTSQFQAFRIQVFAAVVVAGALAGTPACAQGSANADICASTDDAAYSPDQRIAACGALTDALKEQPKVLADALVNRGRIYWYINKTQPAFADLNRAIALDPSNARAFRERSNAYRTAGNLDKALADANEAVRLDPNNAQGFDYRGNVFNNNHQDDRAIADYSEAIRLAPNDAQAFMDRGVAYYFKKDYQAAIKDYDEAIRLDPLYPEYYDNRGLSYADNGDYDRAIADYNEAIRLAPQANFLTDRGDSYNRKGDLDRAIADYDRALALNPGFYLAYNNRAAAYEKKGDIDHAIADYEAALRINPQLDTAAEGLADVRQERDRRAAANSDSLLPTFDCGAASHAAEKAICSDPDLARLDREIDGAYKAALARLDPKALAQLRDQQRTFIANRNKSFGNPQYNLKREMELRLAALRGMSARNN